MLINSEVVAELGGRDSHFFGPIVTLSVPSDGTILLLDGQQRLATATILLSVLREVAREIGKETGIQAPVDFAATLQSQFIRNEEEGLYSIELGEIDDLYFKDTIQSDPPITAKARQSTHRNIKAAKAILREKVLSTIGSLNPQMDALKARDVLKWQYSNYRGQELLL